MRLAEKIEKIRQKPERIRLRYVWGLVVISMMFITTIWIFSIKQSFKKNKTDFPKNLDPKESIEKQLENISSVQNMLKKDAQKFGNEMEGIIFEPPLSESKSDGI